MMTQFRRTAKLDFSELQQRITQHCKYTNNFFEKDLLDCAKSITYDQTTILKKAVEDFVFIFAKVLHAHFMRFLEYKFDTRNVPKETKDETTHLFEKNTHFGEFCDSYNQTLNQEHNKAYKAMLSNFKGNANIFFERIKMDFPEIKLFFNQSDLSQLTAIKSSGSDLHRQGNQVLILEFNNNFKLVYKPSSVEADAAIIGNFSKLTAGSQKRKSFIEILNESSRINPKLPTYLILERGRNNSSSSSGTNAYNLYGYIEFISHNPWLDIDLEDEFLKSIQAGYTHQQTTTALQKIYKEKFHQVLIAASQNSDSDYIIRSEEEAKNYSYVSGCLIAVMVLLGIIDMHAENVVIHKKLPFLIDLENSFFFEGEDTIMKTLAFDPAHGSMNAKSTGVESIYSSVSVFTVEKNRSYLYEAKGNTLIAFKIREEDAIRGLNSVFHACKDTNDIFLAWFRGIKDICVRYIPMATGEFRRDIFSYLEILWGEEKEFKKTLADFIESKFIPTIEKAERGSGKDEISDIPYDQEDNSIFNRDSILPYIDEISTGNVPVYYLCLNQSKLFDFNHKEVQHNAQDFFRFTPINKAIEKFDEFTGTTMTEVLQKYEQELSFHLRNIEQNQLHTIKIHTHTQPQEIPNAEKKCCKCIVS